MTASRPFVTLRAGPAAVAAHVIYPMNIKDYLEQKRDDVDQFLDSVMPSSTTAPTTLHESMQIGRASCRERV